MLGCILGVLLVSITQNGLNLLGISPYAFKMIIGAVILVGVVADELVKRFAAKRRAVRQLG